MVKTSKGEEEALSPLVKAREEIKAAVDRNLFHPSHGTFDAWVQEVPKVELHAHVNGSISPQLLNELIAEKNAKTNTKANGNSNSDGKDQATGTTTDESGAAPAAAAAAITMMSDSDETLQQIEDPSKRMAYCFGIFDTIYKVMDNLEYTKRAVEDVLCAYAAENTFYLELRTSLRQMKWKAGDPADAPLASREDYVETVWSTIETLRTVGPSESAARRFYEIYLSRREARSEASGGGDGISGFSAFNARLRDVLGRMRVNLMLSINRASPVAVADETIDIALRFAKKYNGAVTATTSSSTEESRKRTRGDGDGGEEEKTVPSPPPVRMVGIDFCGNCYKGDLKEFLPSLGRAASHGLQLSLHSGEKDDDKEIQEMLELPPPGVGRFGHLVFINDENTAAIMERGIPAEFCITSNMLTSGLSGPTEHHLHQWFFNNISNRGAGGNSNGGGGGTASPTTATWPSYFPSFASAHPLSINTDDRGVFYTTLNHELKLFAQIMAHEVVERVFATLTEEVAKNNEASSSVEVPPASDFEDWVRAAVLEVTRAGLAQSFIPDVDEKKALCRHFEQLILQKENL